jgi:hypothetical protein
MKSKILLIVLLLCLIAAGWLGWTGYRAAVQARLALADVRQLLALAEAPSPQALPALRASLADLESHLAGLRKEATPFLKVAPLLGWLPQVGPTLRDAPPLLDMAIELAGGGRVALDALMPVVDLLEGRGEGDLLARALPVIAAAAPQLAVADERLGRAEALRAQVRGPLHPRLAPQVARLDRFLPLMRAGLRGAQAVPSLMGVDGSRTYLVLAQNSDELRPTGGFISGVGHVRLENGRISDLKLSDSYAVDNFKQPHPDPPAALREQMGTDLLVLRDTNWSPDFPTSAQVARALYAQDRGVQTDGAIALDLEAVRLLVAALGPLQVPGQPAPITGANVIAAMKQAWESPASSSGTIEQVQTSDWWAKRKDFMGEMVAVALAKLQGGGDLNPLALANALLEMLDGRHLQIAVDDAPLTTLLSERRWDGALQAPESGDFLAVIDTNVGFNKTNAAVKPQIDYRVIPEGDRLLASLTLTYTHTARPLPSATPCDRTPRYGDSYEEMIGRCYWDYLRVYAPAGSELIASEGLRRVKAERGEGGAMVLSGDFVLRPGDRHVVSLRYRLPPEVSGVPYRLYVRKQAGTLALPLWVDAGPCAWHAALTQDQAFACPVVRQAE